MNLKSRLKTLCLKKVYQFDRILDDIQKITYNIWPHIYSSNRCVLGFFRILHHTLAQNLTGPTYKQTYISVHICPSPTFLDV